VELINARVKVHFAAVIRPQPERVQRPGDFGPERSAVYPGPLPSQMKALAYALLTTLALALLMVVSASAQTPQHPTDPNAVLIATYQVTISVGGSGGTSSFRTGGSIRSTSTAAEECQIKANVTVWRTSSGAIDYVLDASSIVYIGSCGSLGLTTADVFSLLSQAALQQGIALGYSPCSTDCTQQNAARVYAALCVRRTGSGESTRYEPCDMTSYCYREYSYCCPNGAYAPQINEIPRTGDGCGAGVTGSCEPTCTSSSKLLR
jgi:hypothetical protein